MSIEVYMKIKEGKMEEYKQFIEDNFKDPFNQDIICFIEYWALLMERNIENGERLNLEIAEETSNKADDLNILTGSMVEMAKQTLYKYWYYGNELRNIYEIK